MHWVDWPPLRVFPWSPGATEAATAPLIRVPPAWQAGAAAFLNKSLKETDDELFDIIEKEKRRQRSTLALIASEVRYGARWARGTWGFPLQRLLGHGS